MASNIGEKIFFCDDTLPLKKTGKLVEVRWAHSRALFYERAKIRATENRHWINLECRALAAILSACLSANIVSKPGHVETD